MEFEPLLAGNESGSQWPKRVGAALALLAVAGMVIALAHNFMKSGKPLKKQVVEIALVKPPPPPPPKVEEKPPEPEIKKEEVKIEEQKIEEVKPLDGEPPPLKDLGVVGEGVAGGDSFGLEARTGGTDLLQSGALEVGAGKGAGDVAPAPIAEPQAAKAMEEPKLKVPEVKKNFGWYTVIVQQHIQDALAKYGSLQGNTYKVVVRVWLASDGTVKRVELVDSSGNNDTDASIKQALGALPKLVEAPPEDLPQPIRLRITARL